jgi:hypothetical protein
MADRFATIKRFFEVTVSTVASSGPEGRGSRRGKDFMRDDLTYGADRAEY